MSTETITIVIKNIPSDPLNKLWKDETRRFKKEFGIAVEKTNDMHIDLEVITDQLADVSTDLISAAIMSHIIMTSNKVLNPEKQTP